MGGSRAWGLVLAVLVVFAAVAAGGSRAAAAPPPPPGLDTIRGYLGDLQVAAPHSMDGYSREKFPHWIDQGDSCNTREVVLKRDGTGVQVGSDCYPTAGRWYSVYDATWVSDPGDVQIDHIVPLADAWRSGADQWTTSRRQDYANDLRDPQLIAVSGSSNEDKSDQDPSQWKPSNRSDWCAYAEDWIDVKHVWGLTVTSDEKSALSSMLGSC